MVDVSTWFETLKGESPSGERLSVFKLTVFSIVVLMLANSMLAGVRAGSLPQIIVSLVFGFLLILPISLYGRDFLMDKTDPLEGFGMWFLGGIPLFVSSLSGVNLLSFGGKSASFLPAFSYLASVLQDAGQTTILKVNNVYAPWIETWLIFSLGIALLYLSSEVIFKQRSDWFHILVAGTPLSLIFAVLHGARSPGFFVFASVFMFLSLALFYFEESSPGDRIQVVSITSGLLASIHATVNISNSGGLVNFLSSLLAAGDFGSLLAFFLYSGAYALGAVYWVRMVVRKFG